MISCYHGFHCDPGAEGGRAATTAFVYSFVVVILMLDVVLAIGLDTVYYMIYGRKGRSWFDRIGTNDMVANAENAGSSEPLIRVEGMSVEFGRHEVLRDIDLSIRRGETVAIIGESGCGKTVLLKTLIGLLQPTNGSVKFDGQELFLAGRAGCLPGNGDPAGFVFQQAGALRQHDDRAEHRLSSAAAHAQERGGDRRDYSRGGWAKWGCPTMCDSRSRRSFPGGMRNGVGPCVQGALEPEVVLYDEPTTGLDPIMERRDQRVDPR